MLLVAALVIAGITLWYSNDIAERIREEEQLKVQLWSEAILQRAQLVTYTQELFEDLRREEREKADRLATAYQLISDPPPDMDLTFVTDYLWSNKTIPVLICDARDSILYRINLPPTRMFDTQYTDSVRKVMAERNAPILLRDVGHTIYYNESYRFSELKSVMQDLINSFISETVINSASVPVILTDSTRSKVVRAERIDSLILADSTLRVQRLDRMAAQNTPIAIQLPDAGTHYIFYEDSVVLKQLQYFPVVQLVLIGLFLITAYLIFSTFRKAEQNQVWVGMAKETAHQLGTPISSLMAWVELLGAQGVDQETLDEINKDVVRLNTITDRFSKIGSKPDLEEHDLVDLLEQSFSYLKTRTSRKVLFVIDRGDVASNVMVSVPLFSWVIENLVKNAVDAMEGEGELRATLGTEGYKLFIDLSDTGKGIPKSQHTTIFEPGFTTKKRGWGLGLSLVKRIVESYHGGKICIKHSEPGKGTTFRILFKRADRIA